MRSEKGRSSGQPRGACGTSCTLFTWVTFQSREAQPTSLSRLSFLAPQAREPWSSRETGLSLLSRSARQALLPNFSPGAGFSRQTVFSSLSWLALGSRQAWRPVLSILSRWAHQPGVPRFSREADLSRQTRGTSGSGGSWDARRSWRALWSQQSRGPRRARFPFLPPETLQTRRSVLAFGTHQTRSSWWPRWALVTPWSRSSLLALQALSLHHGAR